MTQHHDPLEQELAALRPAAPSVKLAERIGQRLTAAEVATPSPGRNLSQRERSYRRVPKTLFYLAPAGILAAAAIVAWVWWRSQQVPSIVEMPLDREQPTLATALDDSLPSVWTFRPALQSPADLESLLDEHTASPLGGHPVQTRGFVPLTMNLNSRLGEF